MKNILTTVAVAFAALLLSTPGFAAAPTVSVPEPISMSLLAGGIITIAAVKRMRRK